VKTRLAVIWAAIVAAGVTVIGVVTGRRRKARAERRKGREARRTKKAQQRGQGRGKKATSPPSRATAASAAATAAAAANAAPAPGEEPPAPTPSASGTPSTTGAEGDDLRAIKGLGAVAAEKLRGAGVTTYAQIAAWTPDEARDIALRLELQPGRVASDDWVGQARALLDGSAADPGSP
jgi:predicted flap endonuclease-1-like 5' DNA nuclease